MDDELRASHQDRDATLATLGDAYSDGRLDAAEFEERSTAAAAAKTLGELAALVQDLRSGPLPAPSSDTLLPARPADVHAQAVQKWEKDRREALVSFVAPTLICWVIYLVTMLGGFPWPAIVTVATLVPLIRTHVLKRDMVASHEQAIMRKAAKAQRKSLEG